MKYEKIKLPLSSNTCVRTKKGSYSVSGDDLVLSERMKSIEHDSVTADIIV